MVNLNAMGIVFSNMHDSAIPELTGHRTMARAEFSAMKLRGGNPEKVILDKLNHLRQRSVSARKSQTEE